MFCSLVKAIGVYKIKDADSEADDSVGDVQPPVSNVTPNVPCFYM